MRRTVNRAVARLWALRDGESVYHPDSHDVVHYRRVRNGRFLDFRAEDAEGTGWWVVALGSNEAPDRLPLVCLRFPELTGQPHLYDVTEEQAELIAAKMSEALGRPEPPYLVDAEWHRIWETVARGVPLRERPYWAPPHMPGS